MNQPAPATSADAAPVDIGAIDHKNFDEFRNKKVYFLARNTDKAKAPENINNPKRTVVILGTGRNGTTMLAGILTILGVEFGDNTDRRLGDEEFADLFIRLRASFLFWRILTVRRDFGKIIKARTDRFPRFAFKSPDLPPYMWLIQSKIPNPYYIASTRNVFETSFGFANNFEGSWRKSILAATAVQAILNLFCVMTKRPLLMVGYETNLRKPEMLVDLLIDYLSLDVDPASRQRAIDYVNPAAGYQPLRRLMGHIDRFNGKLIEGWISDASYLDQSVKIAIKRDGAVIWEGVANIDRQDVKERGFHNNGACGFRLEFEPRLGNPRESNIEIEAPDVGHFFWRPGRRLYPYATSTAPGRS